MVDPPPRNRPLEEQLLAAPDDDALKLIYADWLQERGDDWGELIALQHQLDVRDDAPLFEWDDQVGIVHAVRQNPTDHALYALSSGNLSGDDPTPTRTDDPDETRLRARFRAELLDSYSDQPVRLRWRCGFVDKIFFPQWVSGDESLADVLLRIFDHRASILLRELAMGAIEWSGRRGDWGGYSLDYQDVIESLALAAPRCLTRLVLGAWVEHDVSWTALGDMSLLYEALPRLRELEIQGNGMEFGDIQWPHLTRLLIRSGGLPRHALTSLHRAKWPALREMCLWFGVPDYGGCDDVAVAEPFLAAENMPELRHLGLANAMFTDQLCRLLPSAPVLPRLERLDLSMGTMGDDGGRQLLRHRDAFAHLEQLDLRGNYLSPEMCAQLATLCKEVDTRAQGNHRLDPSRRYTTVSE